MWWVVDRIENGVAVFVSDQGRQFNLPRALGRFREGQVYKVDRRGVFVRNRAEEKRRLSAARRLLAIMKASDPGGNIRL